MVFDPGIKNNKKHPEPKTAQGESFDPWFHLNLDISPHSLPVTGPIRRGISSPRLRDATPIEAFALRKNTMFFSARQEKLREMEKGHPFGCPSVWFNQPMLFSFRVRALFL